MICRSFLPFSKCKSQKIFIHMLTNKSIGADITQIIIFLFSSSLIFKFIRLKFIAIQSKAARGAVLQYSANILLILKCSREVIAGMYLVISITFKSNAESGCNAQMMKIGIIGDRDNPSIIKMFFSNFLTFSI